MSGSARDWYGEGLRFACTRCGDCCRGEGHVWVEPQTIERIAAYLGLEPDGFSRRYVRRVGRDLSLVDKPNLDCVFWASEGGCEIYPVRPPQCRTFPFWRSNLASRSTWDEAARECPGMNQGTLHDVTEIRRALEDD